MLTRAVALWCAAAALATATAYTVDCNHEYTDCDTELSKLTSEEESSPQSVSTVDTTLSTPDLTTTPSTEVPPTRSTPILRVENTTEPEILMAVTDSESTKPKPRLLNLNVEDLQSFANALHNQTAQKDNKKNLGDLSDVNLDGEEDDEPIRMTVNDPKHKIIPDKFFTNLHSPFQPLLNEHGSEETCKENEITYKVGERMDRGCEESCECTTGGIFECTLRCKHPYIRRGRRLNDPLCFESPVDECCSIVACATGNGDPKPTKLEICRYGNDTYAMGAKWNIGCEQACTCERNSIVTCKPRCNTLPPSDNCINVQDPNDACCEVQVCDVSQDAHEEHVENITTSTTTTTSSTETSKGFIPDDMKPMRPLVLSEPIGSVKVLQNNTVQVNLIHENNTIDPIHLLISNDGGETFKDVELKYTNLILNLEGGKDYILKTKETGTKFNFTITTTDHVNEVPTEEMFNVTKSGCYQDGKFYDIGEEFHIGCSELCECVGPDKKECAALVCPSHVGLEILSKGCVRWAPSPPAIPPNCCPRAARCLSDGTCHYKGVAIPNWTEVPVSVSGCEERCFCENGELDCQEACTPLPPLPPQTLRCPPMHRPAPVNISDEDCCKQWGCVPNAGKMNETTYYSLMTTGVLPPRYVTPLAPIPPTLSTSVLAIPRDVTDPTDFIKNMIPIKEIPNLFTASIPAFNNIPNYSEYNSNYQNENATIFALDDTGSPFKVTRPNPSLISNTVNFDYHKKNKVSNLYDYFAQHGVNKKTTTPVTFEILSTSVMPIIPEIQNTKFILAENKMHDMVQELEMNIPKTMEFISAQPIKPVLETKKVAMTKLNSYLFPENKISSHFTKSLVDTHKNDKYFEPVLTPLSTSYVLTKNHPISLSHTSHSNEQMHPISMNQDKHVTILQHKGIKAKPVEKNKALWNQNTKAHLMTKVPNPYETILSRIEYNDKIGTHPIFNTYTPVPKSLSQNTHSPLDFEQLLSQMAVESEVNRNLQRSADKNSNAITAGPPAANFPVHPPHPSFLPTVPPEIHFPQEDDYEQNNIHRPPLEPGIPGLPPGLVPNFGDDNRKLKVLSLQSDSPTSVKMLFGLPAVLVGLRGSVDLRYTDQDDEDISHWYSQVFAPTDEILTTPRLEFTLSGLKPSTTYKIRGKLFLHNLPVEPESDIRVIRTLDQPIMPTEEKRREVDSRLTVVDVNDTTAHVSWRHFTEEELQFIDGIQIRYRPIGTPIYSMTELLHHSRSTAELQELRPDTRYEASLVLIPPPRTVTELHDPGRIEFLTTPYVDPYNWTVTIEARTIGSEAVELTWRGVPSPAERWVRVYRAAHACGSTTSATKEHDAFRLAARDLPPAVTLSGLEPNTRCRVWLELFLTNGKVKTSNVLEINTKSLDSPEPIDNEIESASVAGSRSSPRGDYYGALVVVGVVAALGALTSLLLLLVVVRRHRPRSVPITPVPSAPRESSLPPYDNPAYKLELQQETMDL